MLDIIECQARYGVLISGLSPREYSTNRGHINMSFTENSAAALFHNRVKLSGDRVAVSFKKGDSYKNFTWNELSDFVQGIGAYLLSLGIKKGDRIAIYSQNRYEWWIADQAILSIGAVSVPVYATNTAEETRYILKHSGARLVFVDSEKNLTALLSVKKDLPLLIKIVAFDELTGKKRGVIGFEAALESRGARAKKDDFSRRLKLIKPSDTASIIYTSGTTGNPKGVMLSHGNILSEVEQVMRDWGDLMNENDRHLSFLPLSHVVERIGGYFLCIRVGVSVTFARDISTILDDLLHVRPTIFLGVPRIFEKMHAKIIEKAMEASPVKRALFNWGVRTAAKNVPFVSKNKKRHGPFALRYAIADKLLFTKIKKALGLDCLTFSLSGGGPLSVTDAEFFIGIGFLICEGYGLTETSATVTVNQVGNIEAGSVGLPLPDTKIKLSDSGEVFIKGPQVMKGYFKNKKETDAAFTRDKFFRTGDLGMLDSEGRLYITGRIKDIIITAGGKNISPQNIENALKASPFIDQLALIGDRRKYIAALIIPDFEYLTRWAKKHSIPFLGEKDLVKDQHIIDLFSREIDERTQEFGQVEKIKAFTLLDTPWSQESGELTPTLKVKRRVIEKRYASLIEELYPPDEGVVV